MAAEKIRALATRFFDAIENGDIGTIKNTYAESAVVWHNTDGAESSREENLRVLEGFIAAVPKRRYMRRRLEVFEGGFVQQHLLEGTLADGRKVSLSACIVCEVRDGRITRLDEYFDSAALARWRGSQ